MSTKQDIKRHEGVVYGIYLDSLGKPTAGVGHLINNKSDLFKSKAKQIKKLTSAFNNRLKELQESLPDLNENELIRLKSQVAKEINSSIAGFRQVKGKDNVATYVTNDEFSLSPEKVEKTFEVDFNEKGVEQAKRNFPNYEKFPPNIQNALVNMSYQLGTISTKEWPSFHSALNYGLKTQDYTHAAHHAADSRWFNQTKRRAMEVTDMMGGIAKEPLSKKEMDSYVAPPKPRPEREEEKIDIKLDVPEIVVETPKVPSLDLSGLLQEESKMPVPTNPEAGPSDTVPAMLTPGEAVIPASAAQDPDNIPVIEKMIDEGRAKNRMAEANGVPVNGKEAIMYDDAELDAYHKRNKTGKYGGGEMSLQGFAGGTMNIPKGMHMMPDGSLMKDEDHKGYGHGTMDVPAMIMMAPPKDPAMDEMEKLALKQMGYEMKSKNRTRDTIEKIGLKHLEDTATAEMRQAALDETMRNYGLEVPMPMQPVPQGFQDGSGYITEGSLDQTDLRGMQNLLVNAGVATPAEAFVDPEYAARERKLAELEAEAQAQKEQEALYAQESARQFNLDLKREQEAIASDLTADPASRQRAQAKVAQLEQAVPPVQAPQAPQVAIEEDKKPAPRPDPKDLDDDDEEGGFLATLGKGFSSAFKSVFDPESIATAGIYYAVNRLLGYDDQTAAQQAAAGYNVGQKNRLAKLEYARKMGLESVEDARQRDEQANENIGKLSTFISSQLDDEISDEVLKEAGLSRADIANRVNMMVQGRGLDLSTTKGLNAARTLATRVTANYAKRVNAGLEASPEEEFDRVLLSQYELTQALTDDDGKPLSEAATRGSFDKIRRNVAADRGIKEDEAQFVFEDRVNQAYQIFTNPANADKIQALRDQGLLTPGPGENEFSLFLAYVLKDKDSRVRNF